MSWCHYRFEASVGTFIQYFLASRCEWNSLFFPSYICSCCKILGPDLCWFLCAWPYKNHSYKNHLQPLRELHLFSQQQWEDNIVALNVDSQFSFSELRDTSERGESCRAETIILDLFQQCHACASCWFLWYRYSVSKSWKDCLYHNFAVTEPPSTWEKHAA